MYIRLTEGSINRREWADPMGFISLIYPNIRPAERILPAAPPTPATAPAPEVPPATVAPTQLQALEQRRQSIVAEARTLASSGNTVSQFERLLRRATQFVNEATRALPPRPFPAAVEAIDLLQNCVRVLRAEMEMTSRRVTMVTNCQASSRVLADALSTPLTAALIAPLGVAPVRVVRSLCQGLTTTVSAVP